MAAELLLEIGTEELPSGYLQMGLRELYLLAKACMKENRIHVAGDLETYGTPRRLVLIGRGVSERQENLWQEITGPPKRVAYDKEGNPTKAALGFAQKQGVSVEDLKTMKTSKGEYLYIKRQIPGMLTKDFLAEALPKIMADISWPKSMRWGSVGFAFARPIHWVLALFNGEVIPFHVAGVDSGNSTRGHRFMAPEEGRVSDIRDYLQRMKQGFVVIDPKERAIMVERLAREAAASVGGTPAQDPELVRTVANLVEFPSALCGSFDECFLTLPNAVLITAMKEHQKYFAIYRGEGQLMPNFVAVNNTVTRDGLMARRGHERVLRARLSDANFFFQDDRKRSLRDRLEDLKGVIYQAELGTSYAKVQRFTRLAEYLGKRVLPADLDHVKSAAQLCKCDLVTQMVTEFPSLQGVMGQIYARMEGEPQAVWQAIYEHYLPTRSGGELPTSPIGAVVGCADRMDTIVGCFAVGLEPTGSADPFALRRHALAIIRIVEMMAWDVSLRAFIDKALSVLGEALQLDETRVFGRVMEFFRERYRYLMRRSGYESDLIESIISVEFDRIHQLRSRMDELKRFASESKEFPALARTFKRVTNILKKQEQSFEIDPSLLKETCESTLWDTYQALKDDVARHIEEGVYYAPLELLVRLRKPVDEFFDGVEVLTKENAVLRKNRIALLQLVLGLFRRVADFSKFQL